MLFWSSSWYVRLSHTLSRSRQYHRNTCYDAPIQHGGLNRVWIWLWNNSCKMYDVLVVKTSCCQKLSLFFPTLINNHFILNLWFYWIKVYNYFFSIGSHYSALRSIHVLGRQFGLGHRTNIWSTAFVLTFYDLRNEASHDMSIFKTLY